MSALDLTASERERHLAMLRNPKGWPYWPYLPMKRYREHDRYPGQVNIDTGYAVTADYPTIVLKSFPNARGIILQLACEAGVPHPVTKEIRTADEQARQLYESKVEARYEDLDGLLDAGWRID